jgi:hypothetical protein
MDGVICDFHKRYKELYGSEAGGEGRDRKDFSKNWKHFIETRQFETLDWFAGGKELVHYARSLIEIPIEILSSSGGIRNHSEVRLQKTIWLKTNGVYFDINIVPGRKVKKFFAMKGNVLIDDTEDVIDAFNEAGGIGILHKDVNETMNRLKELL